MRFDNAATTNPIDQLKMIGKATDRIDGPLKTTGTAPYAYERHDVAPNQAYGYVVGSAIAKGRIASIDMTPAKAASGVLAIVTAENAGKLVKGNRNAATLLGGPEIQHYHQAIAVVVAETFDRRALPRNWSASSIFAPRVCSTLRQQKTLLSPSLASPAPLTLPLAISPARLQPHRSSSMRPTLHPTKHMR
jgi:hypothetical protein